MHTSSLLKTHRIISDQVSIGEMRIILTELEGLLDKGTRGSVVEFGCYVGTTSLFIQRLINHYDSSMVFHVYDSFAGLPDKTQEDESPVGMQFTTGELSATKRQFINQFYRAHEKLPIIHKGWFSELTKHDVPDDILFAYLDGDYYESIRDSLKAIDKKLRTDAVIIVDDYANEALPGAASAVDEWLRQTSRTYSFQISQSLAIIRLQ